jgi:hyperosmotically inducible periplasmic protein
MRNFRVSVTALALTIFTVLALGACSTTEPAGQQFDDGILTSKVKAKLAADPDINPFKIDVDTQDGVVSLRGRVEEASDKTVAGRLARETQGVKSVHNEITVGMAPHDQTPGSDEALMGAIKGQLAGTSGVSAMNIDVDVNDGVVTLSGTVKTAEARAKAESIAKGVDGVKSVHNELKVL